MPLCLAFTRYAVAFDLVGWNPTAARELADTMIERFADDERGGFFETASDHEQLVARRKDLEVTPIPAGDNPAAAIAGWAPRLAAVHLKDIGAAGSVVPVGTGRLDVAGTLAALEGAVAAGAPLDHLTIEVEGFADPDAALRRSARAVTGVAA